MAPETVDHCKSIAWPRVAQGGSEMNGDDALSNLRSEMCRNADARAVGCNELEELVHRWATAQNKAPLAERAGEYAQAMANCGADT